MLRSARRVKLGKQRDTILALEGGGRAGPVDAERRVYRLVKRESDDV